MAYLAVTSIQAGAALVHLCNYVLLSLGQGGGAVVLQTSHWIVQYCEKVLEQVHSKRGSFSKTFFAFWLCGPLSVTKLDQGDLFTLFNTCWLMRVHTYILGEADSVL